jgi:DDE superfamily endonuclease
MSTHLSATGLELDGTCRLVHSPNGWTDSELGYEWLVKDFDAQTKDKAGERTCVLLMDGHCSHYSLDLLKRTT